MAGAGKWARGKEEKQRKDVFAHLYNVATGYQTVISIQLHVCSEIFLDSLPLNSWDSKYQTVYKANN